MSGDLVKFLEETAQYFESRPDGGEDRAHWANIYNAENCRKAAAELTRLRSENAELVEALLAVDASWTEECPGGPDGDRKWCHGIGEIADDTIQIWRRIRKALSRVSGGGK